MEMPWNLLNSKQKYLDFKITIMVSFDQQFAVCPLRIIYVLLLVITTIANKHDNKVYS